MTNQLQGGYLLALDTSTRALTAAISSGGTIVAERSLQGERNHSIQLLPVIDALLKQAGLTPVQLAAVAVGNGPGSYTGVRIGVSVAKTFAWALGIPVIAVSSLEALAYSALRLAEGCAGGPADGLTAGENGSGASGMNGAETIWIVPLLDARRGQAYCAVYAEGGADGWKTVIADGIRAFSDWAGELTAMAQEAAIRGEGPVRILFAGETSKFRDTIASLRERVPAGLEIAETECEIRAFAVAELGGNRLASGMMDDVHGLVPNYTQLAEAEVKLLEKERRGGDRSGGVC